MKIEFLIILTKSETQEIYEIIISNIQKYLLYNLKENPLSIKKDFVDSGILLNISKDKLKIHIIQKKKNEVNPKLINKFLYL